MQTASALPKVPQALLKPEGGWNTNVWMFLFACLLFPLVHISFLFFGGPGWLTFIGTFVALHLLGTVIHDASHNSAHKNRIINATMGHVSALMMGFVFPVFTRVHLEHHRHVNDPENDPDHVVSTFGPLWLIAPRFFYHEVYFFQRRLWRKNELLEWFVSRLIFGSIVWASLQYDFFSYIMTYWFLPAGLVGFLLGLFFDYFPHRPFHQRDRWKNARVYASPILNLLIGGQNYHLVHHIWPTIPWYHYQPAYRIVKPLLEAKGSPLRLGILESPKDFGNFVYDCVLGIRPHFPKPANASDESPDLPSSATALTPKAR
ncbi:MAG: fatty acid desaturase [Cyanobacteria bacterium P01_H01_bin.15]